MGLGVVPRASREHHGSAMVVTWTVEQCAGCAGVACLMESGRVLPLRTWRCAGSEPAQLLGVDVSATVRVCRAEIPQRAARPELAAKRRDKIGKRLAASSGGVRIAVARFSP